VLDRLGRAFAAAIGVLILAMMAVTSIDVVLRYFFNAPLKGAFEMTEIGMALVIFSGMSLATVRREHITVNVLESMLSPAVRRWQRIGGDLVCAVVTALLAWRIVVRGGALLDSGETTLVLGVPRGYVAYAMGALCTLAVLVFLWAAKREADRPPTPDRGDEAPQGTAL
jgi:TRAP-type C4-dicarboxylate transport system permease small subunit